MSNAHVHSLLRPAAPLRRPTLTPLFLWLLLLGPLAAAALVAAPRPFTPSEDLVLTAYIAYYGRPGDPAGLRYWAGRLDQEGGNLSGIIQAFGVSEEFTERYGHLSPPELVAGLYQQLFGRDPEPEGLAYYTDLLDSGQASLQTIALDVIFGAQNEDAVTVEHKLEVARYFVTRIELLGDPPPDVPAQDLAALTGAVSAEPATRDAALEAVDVLVDSIPRYVTTFAVTKTEDTADGSCGGDCSLREAVTAANASPGLDLIELPAGHYLLALDGPSEESEHYKDLEIRDDLHVRGAGSGLTVIDGGGWTRVLQIDTFGSGVDAQVSGVTITGGSHAFGAAVLNAGTLTLVDSVLSGNTGFNGGAILNTATLRVDNCTLEGNKAIPGMADTGFGGALWSEGGAGVTIVDSAIRGNNAHYNGGGIYSAGTISLTGSLVESNVAGGIGGGVFNLGQLTLTASTLAANQSNDGGGLASQDGGEARLSACTVEDNLATGLDLGGGAGLFNYAAYMEVDDCLLRRNVAYGEGGGAIETNGDLVIRGSTLTENIAQHHDGALLPSDTSPGLGGALLVIAGSRVTVEDTRFEANRAGVSGGAIYNDRSTELVLRSVDIVANTAERKYGGGINNEGDITFSGGSLAGNGSNIHGGALTTNIGAVVIEDVAIIGNAAGNGGAIGNYLGGDLHLVRVSVAGNEATGGLGGAVINDAGSAVTIEDSSLTANLARSSGGAVYNSRDATFTLIRTWIEDNEVREGNGGGVTNEGTLTFSGGGLNGNRSPQQGGGLTNNYGSALLQGVTVRDNASAHGGGVANYHGGTVRLEEGTLENNSAPGGFGGGVLNDLGTLELVDSLLTGNSAGFGGAFSNNHIEGVVRVVDSTIEANTAPDGSSLVNFGTVYVSGSTVVPTCNDHAAIVDEGGNVRLCD